MPEFSLYLSALGSYAKQALDKAQDSKVIGVTSRGIFLSLGTRQVIFLSFEKYHGPLTLNIHGDVSALRKLERGDPVEIREGKILFPPYGITIHTENTETWDTPSRPGSALSQAERGQRIRAVAIEMLAQRSGGLGVPLARLFGIENLSAPSAASTAKEIDLLGLRQTLALKNLPAILVALRPLIGLGGGLTPSGDDLIIGLLLAYNRWGDVLKPEFDIEKLDEDLTRPAFQKTTLLSANLIACAAQGSADERLIAALDGMMSGSPDSDECAGYLLDWGSSSGIDTLAGIALGLI